MRVAITGGNRGFGLSLAKRLREGGHDVVVTSSKRNGYTAGVRTLKCDVSDPEQVRRFCERASRSMGGIDAWVNSAAAGMRGGDDAGLSGGFWAADAKRVIDTNVLGVLNCTNCALSRCGESTHVFNVYGAGYDGRAASAAGHGVYAASKAAAAFYTRVLAGQGFRVHGIVPGLMDTRLLRDSCSDMPEGERLAVMALALEPDAVAKSAAAAIAGIVANDTPSRVVDCYSANLARKGWVWLIRALRGAYSGGGR